MLDKIAVAFWLCFTAGMLIGLDIGNMSLWLIVGAVVGIVLGSILCLTSIQRRKRVFGGTAEGALEAETAVSKTSSSEPSKPDLTRAA
jgi:hypothetical protein